MNRGLFGQPLGVGSSAPDYPPGYEWGFDEYVPIITISSTSESAPTQLLVCKPHWMDGGSVDAIFACNLLATPTGTAQTITLALYEFGVEVQRFGVWFGSSGGGQISMPVTCMIRLGPEAGIPAPKPGYHTYTVGASVSSTSGGPSVGGNFGCGIRFRKV